MQNIDSRKEILPITMQDWDKDINALVYVQVLTYNHEQFISDCIEGILMQKTAFPVHIVVFEDCSTDNTAIILKEYQLKYPRLFTIYFQPENTYGKEIRKNALKPWYDTALKGKYIAKCEGDDYWTDPLKLQKQVNFLEKNPEYGLVYTKSKIINSSKIIGKPINRLHLFYKNTIPTLTVLFKTQVIVQYLEEIKPNEKNWKMGDYPMWLYFFITSKIYFLNEITAAYRVLAESRSHSKNGIRRLEFNINSYEISAYFCEKFGVLRTEKEYEVFQNKWLMRLMFSQIKQNAYKSKKMKKVYLGIEKKFFINEIFWYVISFFS